MIKILIFLIAIIPYSLFADYNNTSSSVNITPSNTISEWSSDLNKDKKKVTLSDKLTVETWFWNSSSKWEGYIWNINKLLKILSLVVFSVWIIAISILVTMMVFYNSDTNKTKEYKQILFKVIIWLLFYGFIAWSAYVWVINKAETLSEWYYDINTEWENIDAKPSLFRSN